MLGIDQSNKVLRLALGSTTEDCMTQSEMSGIAEASEPSLVSRLGR